MESASVETNKPEEQQTTTGIYCGVNRDGDQHVIIIGGEVWEWKRTKHTNRRFNSFPVGSKFNMDSTLKIKDGRTTGVSVVWESFEWTGEKCNETASKFALSSAAGKRIKLIKSTAKKLDAESIRGLTLQEIRNQMSYLNTSQRAAMLAIIIAEVA